METLGAVITLCLEKETEVQSSEKTHPRARAAKWQSLCLHLDLLGGRKGIREEGVRGSAGHQLSFFCSGASSRACKPPQLQRIPAASVAWPALWLPGD